MGLSLKTYGSSNSLRRPEINVISLPQIQQFRRFDWALRTPIEVRLHDIPPIGIANEHKEEIKRSSYLALIHLQSVTALSAAR